MSSCYTQCLYTAESECVSGSDERGTEGWLDLVQNLCFRRFKKKHMSVSESERGWARNRENEDE